MNKAELNQALIAAFPAASISYNEGIAIASIGTANVAMALRSDNTINASANFNHTAYGNQCKQFELEDLTGAVAYLQGLIATAPAPEASAPALEVEAAS
jgi:hypothetical protein